MPPRAGSVSLCETLKQPALLIRGHPDSSVVHCKSNLNDVGGLVQQFSADSDFTAISEFERIAQKIPHHLPEPSRISHHARQVWRNVGDKLQPLQASLQREHRSEEHTSELQSLRHLVCRLLLEKKN